MFTESTATALSSQAAIPQSLNDETIVEVRSLRDGIGGPGKDPPGNEVAEVLGGMGGGSARKLGMVSLVIPAKNEAANIAWVLEQVPACVDEVILVDGNSTDATLVTARFCRPDVRVVAQQGLGKGDALRAGFLAASGDVIVMIDADGSMSPGEISHFLYFLANGYDFVKGSRFIGGGGSLDITRLRRLGNQGGTVALCVAVRAWIRSVACSIRWFESAQ